MSRRNRRKDGIVALVIVASAYAYWWKRAEPAITFDQRAEKSERVESTPAEPVADLPGIGRGAD